MELVIEPLDKEDHLFFSNQAILNEKQRVWGHELLYRDSLWASEKPVTGERAEALDNATNKYAASIAPSVGGRKTLINFSKRAVLEGTPFTLPASYTVVELDEQVEIDDDLLAALDDLKARNYLLAVDNYEGRPGSDALLKRADIVKVNLLNKTLQQILAQMEKLKKTQVTLVAKGMRNKSLFNMARSLGFSLFQGAFYKEPDIVPGRKLNPSQAARLKLFPIIETGKPDFKSLSEAISMDASISYRLLSFLNSAAFSFPMEISSIQHAVVLLGWDQVKNWIRVVIMSDLTPPYKTLELMRLAAVRGKFFEQTALRSGYTQILPGKLFLLGLFSLLEPMLDMPIDRVIGNLPLDEHMKTGLKGGKNIYAVWIELAKRIEAADWKFTDRILRFLELDRATVAESYYDAYVVANSFFDVCS